MLQCRKKPNNGSVINKWNNVVKSNAYVAFNAIASLGTAALISSYIVSISCIRIKRWRGQKLSPARWSLGKLGAPINDFSILYLSVVFIFSFFPEMAIVEAESMNWNILIYSLHWMWFLPFFHIIYEARFMTVTVSKGRLVVSSLWMRQSDTDNSSSALKGYYILVEMSWRHCILSTHAGS